MRANPHPADCATAEPMLENIPALITPDALHALARMGHGDERAIVDARLPAARLARRAGAIVQCGEPRTRADVPLRKGVCREPVR
jgi:L-fucose mutarotase/ribose pyranase (RbsD/FucU family)